MYIEENFILIWMKQLHASNKTGQSKMETVLSILGDNP